MPRKAKIKKDEKHQLTITVWTVDKPISGDEYMKIESTEPGLPNEPKMLAYRIAAEVAVAAGIQVGNHAKDISEIANVSSQILNAFLKAAMRRLEERNPSAVKLEALASKLGVSPNDLQAMQELLNQGNG